MKYNIRGDKMVVTDANKDYTISKLDRLNKYFNEDDIVANVLTKVRGDKQIIEVTIPTDKFILRSEESNNDLYAAIDLVTDKLEDDLYKLNPLVYAKSKHSRVYAWRLEDIKVYNRRIPSKGRLGLWNYDIND